MSRTTTRDPRQRLDALAQSHPESKPWLALYAEMLRVADDPVWDQAAATIQLAADRPATAPLLTGAIVTLPARAVGAALRRLLKTAGHGDGSQVASLGAAADAERLDALAVLAAAVNQDLALLELLADSLGADPDALASVAQLVAVPVLQACHRRLADQVPKPWAEGFCPVCAAWVALAESRGLEQARHLRCARCGADWRTVQLRCVYCGVSDHDKIASLVPAQGGAARRVETCAACRGYLKTVATLRAWPPAEVALADLATLELDLAALDHGYTRPDRPALDLQFCFISAD